MFKRGILFLYFILIIIFPGVNYAQKIDDFGRIVVFLQHEYQVFEKNLVENLKYGIRILLQIVMSQKKQRKKVRVLF